MAKDSSKTTPSLDLDAFERESTTGSFTVKLGGRVYELVDAQECDYRELMRAQQAVLDGDPDQSMAILLPAEDRDEFFANRLPSYKLEELFNRYNEHYGLPTAGEASASSPFSSGTARPSKRT